MCMLCRGGEDCVEFGEACGPDDEARAGLDTAELMEGRLEQQLSVMSPEEEEARQSLRTQYEAPLHTAHPYHSHMCASRS